MPPRIRNVAFAGWLLLGPVHIYVDSFLSATFSFRIQISMSTRIRTQIEFTRPHVSGYF